MKKIMTRTAAMIAAAAILAMTGGCGSTKEAPKEEMQTEKKDDLVVWAEIVCTDVHELSVSFPAVVTEVCVRAGDLLPGGETAVRIDRTDYDRTAALLEANLSSAEAAFAAAEQDVSAQQQDVETLREQLRLKREEYESGKKGEIVLLERSLARMETELADARGDAEDAAALYELGAAAKVEVEKLEDVAAQREKALEDVRENLQITRRKLEEELDGLEVSLAYKESQLNAAKEANEANVRAAEAACTAARNEVNAWLARAERACLEEDRMVCPVERGLVRAVYVQTGTQVGAQGVSQPVAVIENLAALVVRAEVAEDFFAGIDKNAPVTILPTSAPDAEISGEIVRISAGAQESDGDRVMMVEIRPEDPEGLLLPGGTADVRFRRAEG